MATHVGGAQVIGLCEVEFTRAVVRDLRNPKAQAIVSEVLALRDEFSGATLGVLALRCIAPPSHGAWDARRSSVFDYRPCRPSRRECGVILLRRGKPTDCKLFGTVGTWKRDGLVHRVLRGRLRRAL